MLPLFYSYNFTNNFTTFRRGEIIRAKVISKEGYPKECKGIEIKEVRRGSFLAPYLCEPLIDP